MKSLLHPDDMQDVERRLNTLQPANDARWGRMSSHQAVCHLSDAFRVVLLQLRHTPHPAYRPPSEAGRPVAIRLRARGGVARSNCLGIHRWLRGGGLSVGCGAHRGGRTRQHHRHLHSIADLPRRVRWAAPSAGGCQRLRAPSSSSRDRDAPTQESSCANCRRTCGRLRQSKQRFLMEN